MRANPVRRAGRGESGQPRPRAPRDREHAADDSEGDPNKSHPQPRAADEDSRRTGNRQDEHDDAPDHMQLGPEVEQRARDNHETGEGQCYARERRDQTRRNGNDGTRRNEQIPEDRTHQNEEAANQRQNERAGRTWLQDIPRSSIDYRVLNDVRETRNRGGFGSEDSASENL